MRDGWVETKLGLISDFVMGQAPLGERCNKDGVGTPFVKAGEFQENRPKIVEWTTDPLKLAKSTDVLVCVVGATAGKINLGSDCAIGRSVAAVRPGEILDQFYLYYLLSLELSNLRSGSRGSAQGVITKDDLYRIQISLPPLAEQKRVVDLISSVDSYIEALRQQVDKARKSRNAVLHELLTKGGNDWVESELGDVVTVVNGGTPPTKNDKYWGGEIVWITTTELTKFDGAEVNSSKRTLTLEGIKNGSARMVRAGTTLVGSTATIGTTAIATCELSFNQQISGLIPENSKIEDFFLFYWIQLAKPTLERLSVGTSFKRISMPVLKSISINYPPLAEQRKIVEIISVFDNQIEAIDLTITKTKNLRSALLSDLLSGNHEIPTTYDKLIGAA